MIPNKEKSKDSLLLFASLMCTAAVAYLSFCSLPSDAQRQREPLQRYSILDEPLYQQAAPAQTRTRAQQPDNGHRWCPDPALPVVVDLGDPPCPPREQCAVAHCTRYPDLVPGAAPRTPCRAWMTGAGRQLRQLAAPTTVGCERELVPDIWPPLVLIFADGFETGDTGAW